LVHPVLKALELTLDLGYESLLREQAIAAWLEDVLECP